MGVRSGKAGTKNNRRRRRVQRHWRLRETVRTNQPANLLKVISVSPSTLAMISMWGRRSQRESLSSCRVGDSNPLAAFSEGVNAVMLVPSTSTLLAGDVLVDKGGTVALYAAVTENDSAARSKSFPGVAVPMGFEGFSGSEGLAVNASATVFASERGAGADRVQSFDYVPVPDVETGAPSGVSETGLILQGTVNPEGEAVKECFFRIRHRSGRLSGQGPV